MRWIAPRIEHDAPPDRQSLRYAQCWEDADVVLDALEIEPGDHCLSIASAGDNTLAMLTRSPDRVIAIDSNPAQLACLELRVAAYRALEYEELLELIGSRPSDRRIQLYRCCEEFLSCNARSIWNARLEAIRQGIGNAGRLERYFSLFRKYILPLAHGRPCVQQLLRGGEITGRRLFFEADWDTFRWRWLFRCFFSRFVMARLGRDASSFRYAEGSLCMSVLNRCKHGLAELDPAENPYLHWILNGTHSAVLPFALRRANFAVIRQNLDRLEWRLTSVADYFGRVCQVSFNRFNLSNVFEYVSESEYHELLRSIIRSARPGARLVYWNLLVPRRRPPAMQEQVIERYELASRLHARSKTFFYKDLVIEEVSS